MHLMISGFKYETLRFHIFFQRFQIGRCQPAHHSLFMRDVANPHLAFIGKRHSNDVFAV